MKGTIYRRNILFFYINSFIKGAIRDRRNTLFFSNKSFTKGTIRVGRVLMFFQLGIQTLKICFNSNEKIFLTKIINKSAVKHKFIDIQAARVLCLLSIIAFVTLINYELHFE